MTEVTKTVQAMRAVKKAETTCATQTIRAAKAIGIYDMYLESMYANADRDNNFKLSWREIQKFQNSLRYKYKYRNNNKALHPDEFISRGAGDCEDWPLMTGGLLTYWGHKSYIVIFSSPGNKSAHAVCFLYTAFKQPDYHTSIYLTDTARYKAFNKNVRPNYYIPIDYNVVGGYSRVMGRNWRLIYIDTPNKIYETSL